MTHKHNWTIIKTIWPYPDGWGTWCPGCRTLFEMGLPKEEAEERLEALNAPRELVTDDRPV